MRQAAVKEAVQNLQQARIIAYPTSTVWGLGCDFTNYSALENLCRLKGRSHDKSFILVAGSWTEFKPYFSHLQRDEINKITASYEHPRTWLVPDKEGKCAILAQQEKVAIRVDKHPVIMAITSVFGRPIVSTSANPSGEKPATNAAQLREYFGAKIDYIMSDSDLMTTDTDDDAHPSDIVDLETGEYIRRG